jgi:hypothetical protein
MTRKNEYYISKKDILPQKENPWTKELAHTMKKGQKITGFASAKHTLMNNDTGETTDAGAVVGTSSIVDKEEFIKFFGLGLIEAFSLSKTAKDVFLTILHAYIEKNTITGKPDQIFLTFNMAKEELNYQKSRSTFTSGINELCYKQFMAPTENREGFYWLNPNLFYKGDRMIIAKEYIIEGSKAHIKKKEQEKEEEKQKQIENQEGEV